jgi:hypothetical protein
MVVLIKDSTSRRPSCVRNITAARRNVSITLRANRAANLGSIEDMGGDGALFQHDHGNPDM